MAFLVKILADSIAPCGKRLTTFECTYPRIIHSELLTHRMLSRNSASSRAIPVEKLIQRVVDDPFVPVSIGANQKGMQAGEELSEEKRVEAVKRWLLARDEAVANAREMVRLGVHKQVVNRLIEPWMWITVILSATELDNFYGLRCHKDAEPHFQQLANGMRDAQRASTPRELNAGQWHTPLARLDHEDKLAMADYITKKYEFFGDKPSTMEAATEVVLKVSVGRCARVSYLTHDGRRDIEEDVKLCERMIAQEPLHASPAEHVAQALAEPLRVGNFIGWRQYRKTLPNEHIGGVMP